MVFVDLRDLTSIDAAGLGLFRTQNAGCRVRGIELGLMISSHEQHDRIAEAFVLAGLGDQLHYAHEPDPPTAAQPVRLLDRSPSVRRGRLAQAMQR